MKYDIFISYRREGGYDTAKHLNDLLVRDGYKVSFDIDTLRNGDFDTQLLERIEQCKDFILIVDAHAFDRTLDKNFDPNKDWLRCELAHALKHNKNIIPVFLSGVNGFPQGLPEDVAGVVKKNGPEYNKYYFNDFYKTLKKRFLDSRKSKRKNILLISLALLFIFYMADTEPTGQDNTQTQTTAVSKAKALSKFCGSYSIVAPGLAEAEPTYLYSLELDPVNASCEWIEEDLDIHISGSKGWCGTMMRDYEAWNIIEFSLHNSGKYAHVTMRREAGMFSDGFTKTCKLKLELDDFDNIVMTYISGDRAPGPLCGVDGNYGSATFIRD